MQASPGSALRTPASKAGRWRLAVRRSAANMAWEIATEVSQTKSGMVLEYVSGESGLIMICGLLVIDVVLIRALRSWAAAGISAPA